MSYMRVIPRDLFNESNLLKCYGQLYLKLENMNMPGLMIHHFRDSFDIEQDQSSGNLTISNVCLYVRNRLQKLERPLNSREPYPLYLILKEDIPVFTDSGELSKEFLAYLRGDAA